MTELPKPYGSTTRGVTQADVSQAADALLRAGERPTVEKIRAAIGSGSPNTVGPLLDAWWKHLAGRLDAGPAALHRLPESVAHVAEALWMRALDEGRRRALLEQRMTDRALAQDKERVELRAHVLTLREGEMEARIQDRDRTIAELDGRIQLLTGMLQKEQASCDAVSRRLSTIEAELSAARQAKVLASNLTSGAIRRKAPIKVVRRIKRPAITRNPAPTSKEHKQKTRRR
jgi:Plasmid replication region DNA-binding N-term